MENDFRKDLGHLINRWSMENESNTPDYILADYLYSCLVNFDIAVNAREWHNRTLDEPEVIHGIGEVVSIVERPPLVISDDEPKHSCGSDCHCKEDLSVAQKSHQEYLRVAGSSFEEVFNS